MLKDRLTGVTGRLSEELNFGMMAEAESVPPRLQRFEAA